MQECPLTSFSSGRTRRGGESVSACFRKELIPQGHVRIQILPLRGETEVSLLGRMKQNNSPRATGEEEEKCISSVWITPKSFMANEPRLKVTLAPLSTGTPSWSSSPLWWVSGGVAEGHTYSEHSVYLIGPFSRVVWQVGRRCRWLRVKIWRPMCAELKYSIYLCPLGHISHWLGAQRGRKSVGLVRLILHLQLALGIVRLPCVCHATPVLRF